MSERKNLYLSSRKNAKSQKDLGESEYETTYKRVWEASIDHWRIAALNPGGEDPVLMGKELGEEPLCFIRTPTGKAEVSVSIVVPFADLWLETDARSKTANSPEADSNRSAICRAVLAKRLSKRSHRPDPDDPSGEVILARARLTRGHKGDAT